MEKDFQDFTRRFATAHVPERLAELYRQGDQLSVQLTFAKVGAVTEVLGRRRQTSQAQRESTVREWSQRVRSELRSHSELQAKWDAPPQLPKAHSTLSLIEPTTQTVGELSEFMEAKLDQLRSIIQELGDQG